MTRLLTFAILASVSVLAAAGCGTSQDRRDARTTAAAFMRAYVGQTAAPLAGS